MAETDGFIVAREGVSLFMFPKEHEQYVKDMVAELRIILTRDEVEFEQQLWALFDNVKFTHEYRWEVLQAAFPLLMAYELTEADQFEVTMIGRKIAKFVQFARRRLRV